MKYLKRLISLPIEANQRTRTKEIMHTKNFELGSQSVKIETGLIIQKQTHL